MNAQEEQAVRHLINLTTDRLHRASAGPDDIGSRYARLLELLWKPKSSSSSSNHEPQRKDESVPTGTVPNRLPEQTYMQYSPMNDFSWLDLEAVGDYVSGYPIVGLNSFPHPNPYPSTSEAIWPVQNWQVDLNGNLLF